MVVWLLSKRDPHTQWVGVEAVLFVGAMGDGW